MSALAELEISMRRERLLDRLAESHCHRATGEDSLGIIKGRDALLAAWVALNPAEVEIEHDLGDMIAFRVDGRWSGHRWVWREDGRIVREVVVEDRGESRTAPAQHGPLGELRSGEGQYAASAEPPFPPRFPDAARATAIMLHRRWNARSLGREADAWLVELLRLLPDATFTFEHAVAEGEKVALLWRVMGHHASGRRVRLIGSSVVAGNTDATVIDRAAVDAQLSAEVISYA